MQRDWCFRPTRRRFLGLAAALAGATTFPEPPAAQANEDAAPRGPRNLLVSACSPEKLKTSLLPRIQFQPFPTIQNRAAWGALRAETQTRLLTHGERYLHYHWPEMQATAFLEFARTGDRAGYEGLRTARMTALKALVFAECVEAKGRFLDDISNGIWATCEESFWGVPAHLFLERSPANLPDPREPVVDLFAAETAALLATAGYLLNTRLDEVSPVLWERVYLESERRILQPLLDRNFNWMGLPGAGAKPGPVNNWDPWICWNWLTVSLLLDRQEERRHQGVAKAVSCLDVFLNEYPEDGGCEEGPSYWNVAAGAMFEALELLYAATAGAVDIYRQPLITQMALYIDRAHIAGSYYINPGDASAVIHLDADRVFRFGHRVGSEELMALAISSISPKDIPDSLPAIFNDAALHAAPASEAWLLRDVWLPATGIMAARRKAGSSEGLYLAAVAANNGKSHSHNDTGSFWIFSGGWPVLIDLGKAVYRKESFGPHRYDHFSTQSSFHNLPQIGDVQQGVGAEFRATDIVYEVSDRSARLSMELSTAYPGDAMLKSWRRSLLLDRVNDRVEIDDSYVSAQRPAQIILNLITARRVTQEGAGRLVLTSSAGAPPVAIGFEAQLLAVNIETIPLTDAELRQVWGAEVYRIQLKSATPPAQGRFKLVIESRYS